MIDYLCYGEGLARSGGSAHVNCLCGATWTWKQSIGEQRKKVARLFLTRNGHTRRLIRERERERVCTRARRRGLRTLPRRGARRARRQRRRWRGARGICRRVTTGRAEEADGVCGARAGWARLSHAADGERGGDWGGGVEPGGATGSAVRLH